MYTYINSKLLWKQPAVDPPTWYEKNMLFENSMFNVDENANESKSSSEDPIMLNELDEVEVKW